MLAGSPTLVNIANRTRKAYSTKRSSGTAKPLQSTSSRGEQRIAYLPAGDATDRLLRLHSIAAPSRSDARRKDQFSKESSASRPNVCRFSDCLERVRSSGKLWEAKPFAAVVGPAPGVAQEP